MSLIFISLSLSLLIVVEIGFDLTGYTVAEMNENIEVTVSIYGNIDILVPITLQPSSNTAKGT